MLEDDCRRLRTFDQRAELQTWLQTVSNRLVSRFLQQERRKIGIEDAPPEVFTQQPIQEEALLKEEREEALTEALGKLTPREKKLFELLGEGYKSKEIARVLNIKVESVYRRRNALVKKIQELIWEKK
jgi:RNA polymerase sigma factor (sigma-70 family)